MKPREARLKLPIVDSHLDLAENMTLFGRDLRRSVKELRDIENRTNRQVTVTLPELKHGGKHSLILYSMYQAVKTDAAQTYWDTGKCSQAEEARSLRRLEVGKPRARFVIKFP